MAFHINIINRIYLIYYIFILHNIQLNAENNTLNSSEVQSEIISNSNNSNNSNSSNNSNNSNSQYQLTSRVPYKRSKYAKYTVYVDTSNPQVYTYYGAGVIISKRLVLTAASILIQHLDYTQKNKPELPKRIVAGISTPEMLTLHNQYIGVKTAVPHPAYHKAKVPFVIDIGILYLTEELKLKPNEVDIAPLPVRLPKPQDKCVIVSWIEMQFKGAVKVHTLHEKDVSIIEWKDCKYDIPQIYSEAICIVDAKTSMRPCNLTGGSPIFCNGILVGIVGGWPNCTNITKYPLHHPRVCSSVYHFEDWIASTILDLKSLSSKSKLNILNFLLIICLGHLSCNIQTNF